ACHAGAAYEVPCISETEPGVYGQYRLNWTTSNPPSQLNTNQDYGLLTWNLLSGSGTFSSSLTLKPDLLINVVVPSIFPGAPEQPTLLGFDQNNTLYIPNFPYESSKALPQVNLTRWAVCNVTVGAAYHYRSLTWI